MEYVEFDTKALLRSAYKDRVEGLARGVISGIYSPDEARGEEDLPAVPGGYGAMPRVQQQVVSLDWHDKQDAKAPAPTSPATPPEAPPARNEPHADRDIDRGLIVRSILAAADDHDRRAA